HIHLFGYATPLLYVYFIISFNRNYPKSGILVWSFLLGLSVDVFSNTPGVATGAMTMVALLQPYVLELFIQRDSDEDLQPAIFSLGFSRYLYYSTLLTLIYCLLFFTLETFNFFNWKQWALSVGGSTLLSVILILVVDNLRKNR
ncbi:MAG: rod shape-determining protein MreD, partial [Bacteroidota bacterium]|nr:rod shape-determining protein MreD [Bacteroidota bacterium]